MKVYEALAKAFQKELQDRPCFALLGDANMHWAGALAELGTPFVYTRHEHAAVAAATAFARSTGEVGCATLTCGPGLTQVMTILPIAVRARVPLVIFAGDAPLRKAWYNQGIDHAPFVEACGAVHRALHDPETMITGVHEAFATAKAERVPVVLSVPFDLQKDAFEGTLDVATSEARYTLPEPIAPNSSALADAAALVAQSERVVVLAGLGALSDEARSACIALAQKTGALLATTLPAKGLFHDQAYCLGVAGGYATERAREVFAEADLVIAIGARLASHTFDGGKLTPKACVLHVDLDPQETVQGRKASDLMLRCDAVLGANALTEKSAARTGWRTDDMKVRCARALQLPDDADTPDGALHPMAVARVLETAIPPTCHVINTSGHVAYFMAQMNTHPQSHYTVIREFGAIGNGTSFALGIAAAYPDRPVVLLDGDGSALMHIQELETMQRHGMKVLVVVLNDGAYGSEVHKLHADGVTDAGSVFGRPDFAGIGRGFGLQGTTITDLSDLSGAVSRFLDGDGPQICDIHISDKIASPQILRAHAAK